MLPPPTGNEEQEFHLSITKSDQHYCYSMQYVHGEISVQLTKSVSHNALCLTSVQANWPRGTTISASLMVGSMYCSKAGFTNLLYCLITPSMSRPRSVMSLLSLRTSRMSESVSTKIFMSSSWNRQTRSRSAHGGGNNHIMTDLMMFTFSSSLSANDMMPSNIMTLAPYTVFCGQINIQ